MSETQSCKLNRTWTLKTGVFLLVLMGFGGWALYDAAVLYPARGLAVASIKLLEFLGAADKAGFLRTDRIAVADPRAELAALGAKIDDLRSTAARDTGEGRAAAMDIAKYEWLSALDRTWKLDARPKPLGEFVTPVRKKVWIDPASGEGYQTAADDARTPLQPQALLNELKNYWSAAPKPKPLEAWDLPVQWSFVVAGFGLGGYLVYLIIACRRRAGITRFDPATRRLSLPSGASITPAELEDVDKRLWHKFFVTLVTTDGSHHKLDLLRYTPLEEWVLEMEKIRFPERAAEEAKKAEEARKAEEASAGNDEEGNPKS
jgi:hypothetical protein